MSAKRIQFLDLPLDTGVTVNDVCELLRAKSEARLITFINPAAWALAEKNDAYCDDLKSMSLVLPDGGSVAAACRLLTRKDSQRISFDMTSLADPFFRAAVDAKKKVALVGAAPGVADDVRGKLLLQYPELKIVEALHGYGDFEQKVEAVLAAKPDTVIVGMGAPRQESFLLALRKEGYKGLAITCGGFLDQYLESGTAYYPAWIDQLNLRFLYRLYKEPKRLWRRYFIDYQRFVIRAAMEVYRRARSRVPVKAS